jgi:ferritin-like metal-binding protein YciE
MGKPVPDGRKILPSTRRTAARRAPGNAVPLVGKSLAPSLGSSGQGGPMNIPNLQTLYLDELKDAYDFEHQLLDALPKLAESAHDPELVEGFRRHLDQTREQVGGLERVFANLGEKPQRETCKGMKGLIQEGEKYLRADGDEASADAALIGAAQRVEHYEIAAYGTLRSFAETLGREDDAAILQRILEQEGEADERLSRLAESRINPRAADVAGGRGRPIAARERGKRAPRRSSR